MAKFTEYVAISPQALMAGGPTNAFEIKVRFLGGLNAAQETAFKRAADRWARVIVQDLPSVLVDGEVIDDVLILAEGVAIDGPGSVLGQAGPTHLRPAAAGRLPAKGEMRFDTSDLADMETAGTLGDVIAHEMGHVLGIGTLWTVLQLVRGLGTSNPQFRGARASAEYGKLRGGDPRPVPVESQGGTGTADAHWRETIFVHELMSGFISSPGNPISRVTVGSLADLGYTVDLDAAEPYRLPDLLSIAEAGDLVPHVAPIDHGIVLPTVPTVLPDDALDF